MASYSPVVVWHFYAAVAGVTAIPLTLWAGSSLRAKRVRARAVPQWREYAEQAGMAFEERSEHITLRAAGERVSAHLVSAGGFRTVRWKHWETRLELPAPPSWPRALEFYGTRATSEILGFRQRLDVTPAFDAHVLARNGGEGSAEAAKRLLSDPSVRMRVGRCFEDEPALCVAQERISVRVRGLLSPQRAHGALQSAQTLRTELSNL